MWTKIEIPPCFTVSQPFRRKESVKTDNKSISLESKFQIPTNSTGPKMNECSFSTSWHSLLLLAVQVNSSHHVNLPVRGAVSCENCRKLWDLWFMTCLMTESPHRDRDSHLYVSFSCGFTPLSKQHQWWITATNTEQRLWSGHFPSYTKHATPSRLTVPVLYLDC